MYKVIEKTLYMNFGEKIKNNIERSEWKFRRVVEKFEVGI